MGNLCAVRIFGDLIKSHNPDFIFLAETLVEGKNIKELAEKFGFVEYFAVDRVGRGGGLAVMWKHNLVCQVVDSSNNFIDVHVIEGQNVAWRLTCFYGYPERNRCQESWNLLRGLVKNDGIPWCVFDDFNDMLYVSDKKGPHPHPRSLLDGFKLAIEDCGLTELDLTGGDFTWEKSKGTENWVWERIDRAFANDLWWRKFPLYKLSVSHVIKSDHDPIMLEPTHVEFSRKQFRFRFENTWLNELSFKEEVTRFWGNIPKIHLLPKLLSVSSFMARWGRMFFHKFRDKVKKQKEVIGELVNREDEEGVKRYFEETKKLDELLVHEELYWK
ncbi:uncharacterized protein LOC141719152 [Apium graveolens]|uniref:uncharacterized protein LOC141719152 n=1 Tax=Apium graveolens TaxID=4045 RepID=UPI003D7ABC86